MSAAAAKRTLLLAASVLALVAVSVVGAAGGAPPDKDRDAPSAPENLRVTAVAQTLVRLAWDPSTDNVAVAGYYVFGDRGKAMLETSLEAPEYTLSGLACGQSTTLTLVAFDDSQNRSEKASMTVSSAPCTDTLPPTTPVGFKQVATNENAVVLAWDPSADNVGVVGYGVYRNLQRIASPSDPTVPLDGLSCGSSYDYAVDAIDAAGNRSLIAKTYVRTSACASSPPAPPPSPDTQAPSTPSGLAASSITQTALTLSWNPSTDNVQVTGYDLYRNGTKVASPIAPGASQSGLACGTSYTFAVEALDAAGNRSSRATLTTATSACSTTTPPPPTDTQAPSMPSGLGVSSATRTSASLTWNPSSDNVAVEGYRSYRDGTYQSTTTQPPTTLSGLSCGSAYTFEVDAFDATGNASNRASVIGSTLACPDTQAPSAPAGVVASSRTATSIALIWSASTDNVGVTGYGLYRGGSLVGTGTTTTGIVSGLTCNTNYTLAVDAYDAAGNRSAPSTVMVSTTTCPDTQAPSTPSGLAASNVTQSGLTLSWNPSSDNVKVTSYRVYRSGALMYETSTNSQTVSGLVAGTSYGFSVAALDGAGNVSAPSQITVTTTSPSPSPSSSSPLDFSGDWRAATGTGILTRAQAADYTWLLDGTPDSRLQLVTTPLRRGSYSVKVTVPSNQPRAEFTDVHTTYAPGTEFWGAMSIQLDASFPSVSGWSLFHQFFGETGGQSTGSPPIAFEITSSNVFSLMVRGGSKASAGSKAPREASHVIAPMTRGQWHDFLFHVRLAKDSTGLVEVWHRIAGGAFQASPNAVDNGVNVLTVGGVDQNVYPETGYYRSTDTREAILYNAGLWIRASRAAAEGFFTG